MHVESAASTAVVAKKEKKLVSLRRENVKLNLKIYSFLIIPVLGFFVFSLYPILWNLISSFTYNDMVTYKFVGLDNYIKIFTDDPLFWRTCWQSVVVGGGKLIFELPLSLILAFALSRNIRGSNIFKTVFMLPTIISMSVTTLIFSMLFSGNNGLINVFLQKISLIDSPINWYGETKYAILMIWIISVWHSFGQNMLYFLVGILNVPQELYESAQIDGANSWQEFRYITLPSIRPLTKIVIMLAIISSLKVNELIMLTTGGGPMNSTNVVMYYIYQFFFQSNDIMSTTPNYGYGAAMGVLVSIFILIITVIYNKMKAEE